MRSPGTCSGGGPVNDAHHGDSVTSLTVGEGVDGRIITRLAGGARVEDLSSI